MNVTLDHYMKKITNIVILLSIFLGTYLSYSISHAQEYEPWTGAVVGANIHLGNSETLKSIRRMINEGKTDDAVRESRKFIERLEINSRSGATSRYEYDAYNALCISLTSNKQFEEAIEACDTAIEISPSRWEALNSRGTLNYKTGQYTQALNDYRLALEKAPDTGRIRKVIEHNINISESRVSGN